MGVTGNRTSATELTGRTLNWTYNGVYQLTNEAISSDPSGVNGSVAYGLDPVGNRVSSASSVAGVMSGILNYNLDDQLLTETYDANGNATQVGSKSFTYDSENRLTTMNCGAVRIVYDGFGNQVAETVSGVTTRYLVEDDVNPTGYGLRAGMRLSHRHPWLGTLRSSVHQGASPATRRAKSRGLDRPLRSG